MSGRRLRFALLSLPILAYFAVAATWHWRGLYPLTGDEPHYLLVADALSRGHLNVLASYLAQAPVEEASGFDSSPLSHLLNGYSIHGVGLPVLLLLPYLIAGPVGARIFMAAFAGLIPALSYRVARGIVPSPTLCAGMAFAVSLGLPFAAASSQIYPDLIGGVLILYLAEVIASLLRHDPRPVAGSWLLAPLAASFLPWLHMRLLAPGLLLLAGYLYALRANGGAWDVRRLVPLASVPLSFALLAAYNHAAFGRPTGPLGADAITFDPRLVGMMLLGLHFDVSQGMFLQQPLLLLGLLGVVPLFRADRRLGLLLTAVYASIVMPNAMHGNWYGGTSFVGRFGWAGVLLWTFPLAYAIESSSLRRAHWLAIFACAVGWQILLATQWVWKDSLLISVMHLPSWAPTGAYGALLDGWVWVRLPSFKDFATYLHHPANWICVATGLLLLVSGWLRPRGQGRLLAAVWVAWTLGSVAIIANLRPARGPWGSYAAMLPGLVGRADGSTRIAVEGRDLPGFLVFGPYARLPRGAYAIAVDYVSTAIASPARWDVVFGNRVVAAGDLAPSVANGGRFETRIPVGRDLAWNEAFQIRIHYDGRGTLIVKSVSIVPLAVRRATMQSGARRAGVGDLNGDGRIVVACLGDSNTDRRWPPPDTPKWCELAGERLPDWTFVNHAISATTVTRPTGEHGWSGPQLDAALSRDAPDAVVLAFGTNDVRFGRATADIVAGYRTAVGRIEAGGARAFVALAPPICPPEPEHADALQALNEALRGAFPSDRLVDFWTGMTVEDFEPDGLHPNVAGQRKRADAALRALRPPS